MALVLLSARSLTRSGVRAITLKQVFLAGAACLLLASTGGFGIGMIVGQSLSDSQKTQKMASMAPMPDAAREAFAFRTLGDMAGRLVKLESDARVLIKRLGTIELLEKRLGEIQSTKGVPSSKSFPGSVGGRELPPRACADDASAASEDHSGKLRATEQRISCLQNLIAQMESLTTLRRAELMHLPTQQPVSNYRLGSTFGNRADPFSGRLAFHSGMDFSADTGTAIRAAGGGQVSFSGQIPELGNVLEIDHGRGLRSRYAHCSRLLVKQGELVKPGQTVAEVGSTGRSTGPHLHFEVLKDGMFVDPMPYLSLSAQVAGV